MIIVATSEEASRVLDQLKELHDAGSHNYGHEHNKATLRCTRVVALDQLTTRLNGQAMESLRLEEIPSTSIQVFESPQASDVLVTKVKTVLKDG
jgi:hypothetical protein